MGRLTPSAVWNATYAWNGRGWKHGLHAALDQNRPRIILVSELWNAALPEGHPFLPLLGVKIAHLDAQDMWYVLSEVERTLKPARSFLFWRWYEPTVRVILPEHSPNPFQVGLLIGNPYEQSKLSALFREALEVLETV